MAKKNDHKGEELVGWVTVKGKHFPKWADGTIGWQDGEDDKTHKARQKTVEQATKEANKAVKKADKDWEEYHAKQQAQESLEHKRNIALNKIAKMKDLDEYDREDIEYLYKDTGGAWVHSDAMERAIEAPLSGRKTATEKSLRRNFDNMMRAWEDTAYTTQSKEGKAFLEKEMKGYKDRFEANMQQWSGKDKQRKTASMDIGNGLRLTADVSDPYKNYSEVERAKKVNREKQYADKKLNQYRKAAQEEKAKAQSIADAISARTGIANTGSRNARYDTSRANLSNGKSQLPNIRSTKARSYSRGEKVAASVGALGNNRKAARHLKSENRRSTLIEIAENAGVSSSKLRRMDTEDIRAMLLSMLQA